MISTLFSSLNTNKVSSDDERQFVQKINTGSGHMQPILIVLQRTMPVWKEICNLYMNDAQVLEVRFNFLGFKVPEKCIFHHFQTLCGAVHHALVNLMDDIKPLLSDLCVLILGIFQNKCVPPALDIAATVSSNR